MSTQPSVLITGASSGIGATYADRFARRGHDLVLVARDQSRMEQLAERLRAEHGVAIDILRADLVDRTQLAQVEARLRDDSRIGILINNAGASKAGAFGDLPPDTISALVDLNVTAVARLASAAASRFVREQGGAIVNIGSVLGIAHEIGSPLYGATKAFVLMLSQTLQRELGPGGVYVQAVLPAATATEIWDRSGRNVDELPPMMSVDELVDAALVGFDRREAITLPLLPDTEQWDAYDAARKAMLVHFSGVHPAERYRKAG
ncbi:SDR family NAD(P)-dependent oxidoreductase [Dyella choica]|uniref:NADP-dependent 3-hydroxy acid dehydrogenase YdfG n=1 Tax=Dyella choica TaxID=1927959 RepID=A0A3S0RMV4_9GAMM|nr:SDR family oxidoreductase [Dyella choica]RUL78941.1 SDR family oxidoreductase [Dyella choica]